MDFIGYLVVTVVVVLVVSVNDFEFTAVVSLLVALLAFVLVVKIRQTLDRHEAALKWFKDHIYIHGDMGDPDECEELEDLFEDRT